MSVEPRWLRASEAALIMGTSKLTVYRLARAGQIPALKMPGLGVRVDRVRLEIQLEQATMGKGGTLNTKRRLAGVLGGGAPRRLGSRPALNTRGQSEKGQT